MLGTYGDIMDFELFLLLGLILVCIFIGLVTKLVEACKEKASSTVRLNYELEQKIKECEKICAEEKTKTEKLCKEYESKKEFYEREIADFDSYINGKCAIYPHLAAVQADLLTAHYTQSAQYLRTKPRRAPVEASRIDELKRETEKICAEKKLAEYKLSYILTVYPELQCIFSESGHIRIDVQNLEERQKQVTEKEQHLQAKEKQLRNLEENYQSIIPAYNYLREFESRLCSSLVPLIGHQTVHDLVDELATPKLLRAMDGYFSCINFTASVCSGESVYQTSLMSCTCDDFKNRHKPCKHMLWLATQLGILTMHRDDQDRVFARIYEAQRIAETKKEEAEKKKKQAEKVLGELKAKEAVAAQLDTLIQGKCKAYPYVAATIADLTTIHYLQAAEHLRTKKNPAIKEAIRIKDLRKETVAILTEKKELEYQLAHIRAMFPNIDDIFDDGFNEYADFELETDESTDRVRLYLSDDEFRRLSTAEKNQLALDRYVSRNKTKWQIGRDYEMYIGFLCESRGYHVQYTGILQNLEDMGRDLMVTNDSSTYIVQCKNWSKEKTIHEKHIFQLFGTVTLYNLYRNTNLARGVFVTTTRLSDTAERIAKALDIRVIYADLGEFPRIKCNVNHTSGEKIYHLPFDQQYDRVVIVPSDGECYATTVKEAESKGFRRAFKHHAS